MKPYKIASKFVLSAIIFIVIACGSTVTNSEFKVTSTPNNSQISNTQQNVIPTNTIIRDTSTPNPTDTSIPQMDLQVGSYSTYIDSIGVLYVVGEIVNKGNASAQEVQLALSLLDDNDNVLAVGTDTLSYISANGKFPFSIMIDNAPKQWKSLKIQIQGSPYDPSGIFAPYIDLKIDKVTGKLPSVYGYYSLMGIVINTGQGTATLVNIVASAYDKNGKVIDVGWTYATLNEILPGGDSPFSLDFGNITTAPASYEVFAVGLAK